MINWRIAYQYINIPIYVIHACIKQKKIILSFLYNYKTIGIYLVLKIMK